MNERPIRPVGSYLTRDELAELCGCAPQSYKTMAKRLRAMNMPFIELTGLCPRVMRSVHDERMAGKTTRQKVRPNWEAA